MRHHGSGNGRLVADPRRGTVCRSGFLRRISGYAINGPPSVQNSMMRACKSVPNEGSPVSGVP
jgi:hypothetical protein